MAIDTASPRSRRTLLAAALGAGAATVASALGRPLAARAADGETMIVGGEYVSTSVTKIDNTTNTDAVIWGASNTGIGVVGTGGATGTGVKGESAGSGTGVYGNSASGVGLYGESTSATKPATLGLAYGGNTAIYGYSGPKVPSLPATPAKIGVYGYAWGDAAQGDHTAIGVKGEGPGIGTGVYGFSPGGTGVWGQGDEGWGVYGESASSYGVVGDSSSGVAVYGNAGSGTGVYGASGSATKPATLGHAWGGSTGVQGFSGGSSIPATPAKTGVYGYAAQDAAAVGVKGESTAGTGGLFTATTGTALQVAGKARFSRSGRATVLKGKYYVDITVAGGLASNSVVHATLQTYRSGVAIAAVRINYPSTGKARIYLTKVASTTAATSVGWFVAEY